MRFSFEIAPSWVMDAIRFDVQRCTIDRAGYPIQVGSVDYGPKLRDIPAEALPWARLDVDQWRWL